MDDLAKRKPSPGGGSVLCLFLCTGLSLIEKAINYSFRTCDKSVNVKLKRQFFVLHNLRKKIYSYIDSDGYIFEKIIQSQGRKKAEYIEKSEQLVIEVAQTAKKVFFLAKKIESGIKMSIISDFYIGLHAVRIVFLGCVLNLEANHKIFGKKNRYINVFKNDLKKWQKF